MKYFRNISEIDLKSIIKHDKPKLFGKVNRREDTRDTVSASVFEEFRKLKGC